MIQTIDIPPTTYTMKEVAKILDLGYGRTTLFDILRIRKILDSDNLPYQQYINRGYFKVREKLRPGHRYTKDLVTVVTSKGLDYLKRELADLKNTNES
jgi:anti-repressor protein